METATAVKTSLLIIFAPNIYSNYAKNGLVGAPHSEKKKEEEERKKDLLLEISCCRLADYVKEFYLSARRTCSTNFIFFSHVTN